MESTESSIAPRRLKRFVRHLSVITKRHQDREKARVEMREQMERLKKFSTKKKEMDEELRELDSKVSEVLEREKDLLSMEKAGSSSSGDLMRKTIENRQMINEMKDSLSQIKDRLETYIDVKTERQRKINHLEKKIRSKVKVKNDLSSFKKRLASLEELYERLKREGEDVSRVEDRIKDLKLRLSVVL